MLAVFISKTDRVVMGNANMVISQRTRVVSHIREASGLLCTLNGLLRRYQVSTQKKAVLNYSFMRRDKATILSFYNPCHHVCQKSQSQSGMVVHALIPALRRQREEVCEFKFSLVTLVSSRTGRAT